MDFYEKARATLQGIPDILYKYRDWDDQYHKRLITHKELFLSSADLFNDPFDAALPFQYKKSELTPENIRKKLIMVATSHWPNYSQSEILSLVNNRIDQIKDTQDPFSVKTELNDMFGIFSLTKNNDNLLMWSHYSKSHKGFCIGFDKIKLFATTQGVIGKVRYKNVFPFMPLFNETTEDFMQLILTKSKHWKYEDEYRIAKPHGARSTATILDGAMREIIFGLNMPKSSKEEIIKSSTKNFSNINFFDAVIDKKRFKLNIVKYDR